MAEASHKAAKLALEADLLEPEFWNLASTLNLKKNDSVGASLYGSEKDDHLKSSSDSISQTDSHSHLGLVVPAKKE